MANTLSAKKAIRVSERRHKVNVRAKDAYKEARKEVLTALKNGKLDDAKKNLSVAYSKIDSAVKKKVLHKNTGSRYKSRISALVKKADKKS